MNIVFIDPGYKNGALGYYMDHSKRLITTPINLNGSKIDRIKQLKEILYKWTDGRELFIVEDYIVKSDPISIKGSNTLLINGVIAGMFENVCFVNHSVWSALNDKKLITNRRYEIEFITSNNLQRNEHESDVCKICTSLVFQWKTNPNSFISGILKELDKKC